MSDIENESINNDDSEETPEVFAVKQGEQGWEFTRREFIAAMGISAGVLATGCVVPAVFRPTSTATPTASATPRPSATSTQTETSMPSNTPTPLPTIETDLCRDPRAHKDIIRHLSIAADGSLLVSGSNDGTVKVWSLPQAELLNTISYEGQFLNMACTEDGRKLAIIGASQLIQIYSVPDCEILLEISYGYTASCMAFSPDGNFLVVGFADHRFAIYLTDDGSVFREVEEIEDAIIGVAISPDGNTLATAFANGTVGLWSFPQCERIQSLKHVSAVDEMVFSHDSRNLFTHIADDQIVQWSIPEGLISGTMDGFTGLAISQDDALLIYGGQNNTIQIWSLSANEEFRSVGGQYNGKIKSIAISPNGSILVAGNNDGSLYLWSLPNGSLFSCPIDLNATSPEVKGITYQSINGYGETVTYTLPCGVPLPEGTVCICNCVEGSACACVGHSTCSCVGYAACICDTNCGCVGNVVGGSHYWYPD